MLELGSICDTCMSCRQLTPLRRMNPQRLSHQWQWQMGRLNCPSGSWCPFWFGYMSLPLTPELSPHAAINQPVMKIHIEEINTINADYTLCVFMFSPIYKQNLHGRYYGMRSLLCLCETTLSDWHTSLQRTTWLPLLVAEWRKIWDIHYGLWRLTLQSAEIPIQSGNYLCKLLLSNIDDVTAVIPPSPANYYSRCYQV